MMRQGLFICILCVAMMLLGCSSNDVQQTASLDQQQAASKRLALGLTYLQKGNYVQAKSNLDKALAYAPDNAKVQFGLAYYYQTVAEKDAAHKAYQTAIKLDQKDAEILNAYGAFLCTEGKYLEAENYFLKAVESGNSAAPAETYENLALCAQSAGNANLALSYLDKALNHEPRRASSLLIQSELYYQQQAYDAAIDTLERYRLQHGLNLQALQRQFLAAFASQQYALAQSFLLTLQQRFPQQPESKQATQQWQAKVDKVELVYHVVKAGETLYQLTRLYSVSLTDILNWNAIDANADIAIGQRIIVKRIRF